MTIEFEKYEKAGQIAVLYSPGYGAGWYTWNSYEGLLFDKEIVEAVLAEDKTKAIQIAERKYPEVYCGGAEDLTIRWVDKGSRFTVREYDGNEHVEVFGPEYGILA